jgi:uncharacterized protein YhhL (DUF1145 family)
MKKFIALSAAAFLPFVASAQTIGIDNLIYQFGRTLQSLIPIMIVIAVLAFFYSVIMFIIKKDDPEKSAIFKKQIGWELIALVLLFGWFGFVKIFANTLGIQGAIGQDINSTDIPMVNF